MILDCDSKEYKRLSRADKARVMYAAFMSHNTEPAAIKNTVLRMANKGIDLGGESELSARIRAAVAKYESVKTK